MKKESKRKETFLLRFKKQAGAWVLLIPVLIVMYLMVWRPTVTGFVWSLFKMKGYTPQEFIGLKNYINVVTNTEFIPILKNTIKYVLWSLLVGFVPPVFIAIMVNEMVHFKKGFRLIIYLPAVIPAIAAYLMWYFMYYPSETGLLNVILTKLGFEPYLWLNDGRFTILYIIITATWQGFAGTMIMYYAALQSVKPELYEAATIDGVGMWGRLRHVTIPQISGVLLLAFVRQVIDVFQIMEQPMTMTGGGPNGASTSLGYQLYQYGFVNGRVGEALALGVIIFLILVIATIFYFKLNRKMEENV